MGVVVTIWVICLLAALIIINVKYQRFLFYIELEDLKNGEIINHDRGYYRINLGIARILGRIIPFRYPFPIIRKAETESAKIAIRQHNIFVKVFWVLFVMPLPATIINLIVNS